MKSPTDDYRRRARRLRHLHAGDPVGLQRSLAELSRSCSRRTIAACGFATPLPRHAAKPQAAESVREVASPRTDRAAANFARRVAEQMSGPVLHYSARQQLLRQAIRAGIGRFEANLIIAAVQHRVDGSVSEAPEPAARSSGPKALLLAGVVQATILVGVWWIAC
jgi:hypothetical protein